MEGWRQERLGSRAGTHREKEKNKNILTGKERKKTHLTLTGLLMEGDWNVTMLHWAENGWMEFSVSTRLPLNTSPKSTPQQRQCSTP